MPFPFNFSENGFSMFNSGITDAIYVLPLQPGSSYSLVAVGIDQVGNQMDLGTVLPDIIMNITTSQETGMIVKKENNANTMTSCRKCSVLLSYCCSWHLISHFKQ